MKAKFILPILLSGFTMCSYSQVLLNEVYSDPGAGKHEFFELYNTNTGTLPESMDNYTLVTFFDISGSTGFYILDLPNLNLASKGYFVGSSAIPFNYQGYTNSTASDFNWNSPLLVTNNGYLKKWVKQTINLSDGNPNYDEAALPANFNDFFYRRTGTGASYTLFLYKNGVLINAVIFGTGGYASVIPAIIAMPALNINMSGASPDFTIDFSNYQNVTIENVNQDAGSDNGFIREADGKCGSWVKSSSQVQHTPRASNGTITGSSGSIAVSTAITPGTSVTGSWFNYNVLAAPAASFPVSLEVYTDNGTVFSKLDGSDPFIEMNSEDVVSDGPFTTNFTPYNSHILLVVKSSLGCIDKIIFVPNSILLPVKLISFRGSSNQGNISLEWTVANNEHVNKLEIERSTDGNNFESINSVFSSGKNGDETYRYSGTEEQEKSFYRLKITDKAGIVTYSKVLVFSNQGISNDKLNIIGNSITDRLTVSIQSQTIKETELQVLDMNGKLILREQMNLVKGNNFLSIALPAAMNSGMYIAIMAGANTKSAAQFIKH